MSNYNTTDTAYASRTDFIQGVAGDWYFGADPHAGFELLCQHIEDNDYSEVIEFFADWNSRNPGDWVTQEDINDAAGYLIVWYTDNYPRSDT